MADNTDFQLAKLEAKRKAAQTALAEADAELATHRQKTRAPKLADLKQTIADYGFIAADLFGNVAPVHAKPKAKGEKRGPAVAQFSDGKGNSWGGGKGPRPQWVKAIQDAGGNMEQYRIAPKATV